MLSWIEYFLCCYKPVEEEIYIRDLDILEKEFIKYKEVKQKKKPRQPNEPKSIKN